jgi:carbon monoxide dehydrogenase subunit G
MTTFQTSRDIAASPDEVFAAFADPHRLATWWGPAGFRNTFDVCEFRPGGAWQFTMHGPDGASYPNTAQFVEIDAPHNIVIDHTCMPFFRLTVTLSAHHHATRLKWAQVFDDANVAAAVAHIVVPANEQNLDRLATEVAAGIARARP